MRSYDDGRWAENRKCAAIPYGAWLLHLRKEKILSQQSLSEATNIPARNIAYWERTGKLKGRKEILALAKSLGVSVETLLRAE